MSDIRLSQSVSLHARQDLVLETARASGEAQAFGDFSAFDAGRDSLTLGGVASALGDDSLAARSILRHIADS